MVDEILELEKLLDTFEGIELEDNTKELLQKGIPVYVKSEDMKDGQVLKIYPDGNSEVVEIKEILK